MPGPNPGTPVLCEPAQSKRTWTFHKTFHKSNFAWNFARKVLDLHSGAHVLFGNLQEKTGNGHFMDMSKESLCVEIYVPDADSGHVTLHGNSQDKTHTHISHEPFCVEIYRTDAGPQFRGARFVWKFTRKNLQGDVMRTISRGIFQEMPHPWWHVDQTPGLLLW